MMPQQNSQQSIAIKTYSAASVAEENDFPFITRLEFAVLSDHFNRFHCHHVIFQTAFSALITIPYFQALLCYLLQQTAKSHGHAYEPELIVVTLNHYFSVHDFALLAKRILANHQRQQLIVIENMTTAFNDSVFCEHFMALTAAKHCRLILISNPNHANAIEYHAFPDFCTFKPTHISFHEQMLLLKHHCLQLCQYHQVNIPETAIYHAAYLAKRYLPAEDRIKNTLLLLDSAAARSKSHHDVNHHFNEADANNDIEAIVNMDVLNAVVASITQIPAHHFERHQFNSNDFVEALQQDVAGQDDAIATIAKYIQQSSNNLQIFRGTFSAPSGETKRGPLLCFTFVGCKSSGKKTMALSLSKHFFADTKALLQVQVQTEVKTAGNETSFANLKCCRYGEQQDYATLASFIQQMPFAVILLEDAEQLSKPLQIELNDILMTGFSHDSNGQRYDFQQAIFILTTTQGALPLQALTPAPSYQQQQMHEPSHLMQFVEAEQRQQHLLAAGSEEIMAKTLAQFQFMAHTQIIAFLPLIKSAVEKIIYRKLTALEQQLHTQHHIELGFAPEIIRYLTDETLHHQDLESGEINLERTMKMVYQCIQKGILNRHSSHPKTLFLQLNDTGQLLRCG